MKCLRVNQDGDVDILEYTAQQFLDDRLESFVLKKGGGEYVIVEYVEIESKKWICYGWLDFNVFDFNLFNFAYSNPIGDVMVICLGEGLLMDTDREEFISLYQEEDNLEDFLIQDETEDFGDRDTGYDYGDWCVRSDDEN